jgi:hypothetical protein
MKNLASAIALFGFGLSQFASQAQIVAVQSANQSLENQSAFTPDLTLGWRFTVGSASLSVTELGYFDSTGNGLLDSHRVGIWDSGGNLLADTTLAAGAGATLAGSYRFDSITPVTLNANESYFIGGWSSGASDVIIAGSNTETIASQITFNSHAYNPNAGFASPTTTYGSVYGNFGPNFAFTPVPEPHEYAMLFGAGLLGFALIRRRFS